MEWFVFDRDLRHEGVNLKTLNIISKWLFLDAWLGPGRASSDGYITVLKIQTKTCKDKQRWNHFNNQQFLFEVWVIGRSLQQRSKVPVSCRFQEYFFGKFSAKYYQSIEFILVKFNNFSIFFWITLNGCVLIMKIVFKVQLI